MIQVQEIQQLYYARQGQETQQPQYKGQVFLAGLGWMDRYRVNGPGEVLLPVPLQLAGPPQ